VGRSHSIDCGHGLLRRYRYWPVSGREEPWP